MPPPSILPVGAASTDEPHRAVLPHQQNPAAWEGAPSAAPWRTTGASAPPCPCPHAGDIPGPAPGVGHKQLRSFLPPGGHKGCRRGGEDGAQVLLGAGQIKEEKAKEEGAAARGNIGRLLPAINISETFGPAAIALHGAAPCTAAPSASLPFIAYLSALFQLHSPFLWAAQRRTKLLLILGGLPQNAREEQLRGLPVAPAGPHYSVAGCCWVAGERL